MSSVQSISGSVAPLPVCCRCASSSSHSFIAADRLVATGVLGCDRAGVVWFPVRRDQGNENDELLELSEELADAFRESAAGLLGVACEDGVLEPAALA